MPSATLKVITPSDPAFAGVWALREEVLRRPIGLSLRNEDLSGEAAETIIAAMDESERVIGCLLMRHVSTEEVKLRQMAVSPEAQRRGIGRLLLVEAESLAAEGGYGVITLHARQAAVPFYEKAGYAVKGGVFEEVGIPHLFMNKRVHAALP